MICITGTPGTGKSRIKEELLKKGYEISELDDVSGQCITGREKGENIVDEECLGQIKREGIIVGHLSHFTRCDVTIVLRGHLKDIHSRLRERGYPEGKIMDNVECEAIDLIGNEARSINERNTYEILNEDLEETMNIVENIIKGKKISPKIIDLAEEILDWY